MTTYVCLYITSAPCTCPACPALAPSCCLNTGFLVQPPCCCLTNLLAAAQNYQALIRLLSPHVSIRSVNMMADGRVVRLVKLNRHGCRSSHLSSRLDSECVPKAPTDVDRCLGDQEGFYLAIPISQRSRNSSTLRFRLCRSHAETTQSAV
jgi:hypothetical protein